METILILLILAAIIIVALSLKGNLAKKRMQTTGKASDVVTIVNREADHYDQ